MLYRFERFDLDDEVFALRRDGADVPLRPQALDVLLYLLRHRERVVLKRELLDAVWRGVTVSDSTLPQAILSIRRALDDDGAQPRVIQTVRARGYRFIASIELSHTGHADLRASTVGELVGRDETMARLDELVRRASGGTPSIALVIGGPGAGKSRVLEEIASRARTSGVRVLEASCDADSGLPELWPWSRLARAYADSAGAPLAAEASRLATSLSQAPEVAQQDRFVAFDAVVQLLRRAAQREPVLLLLDDLHHASAATLLLLKLVASSLGEARVAMVVSYRDGALADHAVLARTVGALTRDQPTRRLTLDKLSRADVSRLAASMLGRAPDEALVGRLMEKTDGNPLLVTQMLQALLRAGSRQSDGSTSALLAVDELREAIAVQLDALSPPTRPLLRRAAVLGTELTLAQLATITGAEAAGLLEHVDEALRARVLAKKPDGAYRFLHVLVRDVLYRELKVSERFALHRAAGVASLARGDAEDAVCHLERALREIDVPAAVPEAAGEQARARAEALLRLVDGGRAPA